MRPANAALGAERPQTPGANGHETSSRPAGPRPESSEGDSVLRNLVRGWDRFWFTPLDPTTLGLMRLCAGLMVFYVHLTYSWGLFGYVGPRAWVSKEVADYVITEIPISSLTLDWGDRLVEVGKGNYYWSIFFHVTSPGWIVALHVFFLASMLLWGLGLWTRYTGALTWLGAMSYVQRASTTVFGMDAMMLIVLLYLQIAPAGAAVSLDRLIEKWRARRRGEEPPEVRPSYAANFATRLVQVHFCIIYLATGTSKLLGTSWWSGTALNNVLLNNSFAPMDQPLYFNLMKFLASHRVLWEVFVSFGILYTLLVEISFPFLVWQKSTRWLMVCCSVLLHTGIGLCMGLSSFSLMMMVMVLSFVPPELVRRQLDAVQAALARLFARRPGVTGAKTGELVMSR
jgi:hypothetical protein